jgi:hypothetical protein
VFYIDFILVFLCPRGCRCSRKLALVIFFMNKEATNLKKHPHKVTHLLTAIPRIINIIPFSEKYMYFDNGVNNEVVI